MNMNFNKFFLLLWVIFALLDPDPDSESGSGTGSTDPIESGSNPDPQPWFWCRFGSGSDLHFDANSYWKIRKKISLLLFTATPVNMFHTSVVVVDVIIFSNFDILMKFLVKRKGKVKVKSLAEISVADPRCLFGTDHGSEFFIPDPGSRV